MTYLFIKSVFPGKGQPDPNGLSDSPGNMDYAGELSECSRPAYGQKCQFTPTPTFSGAMGVPKKLPFMSGEVWVKEYSLVRFWP